MRHTTARTAANKNWPKLLVVECFGIRCLAYRDGHGRLRDFWKRLPLPGPVQVLDPED